MVYRHGFCGSLQRVKDSSQQGSKPKGPLYHCCSKHQSPKQFNVSPGGKSLHQNLNQCTTDFIEKVLLFKKKNIIQTKECAW